MELPTLIMLLTFFYGELPVALGQDDIVVGPALESRAAQKFNQYATKEDW